VELDAIPLAALGAYLLMKGGRHKKVGGGMLCLSILWLPVAHALIYHFGEGSLPRHLERVSPNLGNLGGGQIWLTLSQLSPTFLRYLFLLLAPLAFLPLADLFLLATSVPSLLVNLFASAAGYAYPMKTNSWHVAPILPIMFLASISGMGNIVRRIRNENFATRLLRACSTTVLLAAALCTYLFGPLPFAHTVDPARYAVDGIIAQSVAEVKALVPPEASLAAARCIASNLTQRRTIHMLRGNWWKVADYVLLDLNDEPCIEWAGYRSGKLLPILEESPFHELIYAENSIFLFRHRPPPMEYPLLANLGNMVQLFGYDLSTDRLKPGDTLQLTLYWQALNKIETNYTVFTHLLDKDNHIWGQKDNWPVNNTHPTTKWAKGEIVVDRYDIIVDRDAPPGEYTLEIGMYDLATNERLPVIDAQEQVKDNAIILGYVWVENP